MLTWSKPFMFIPNEVPETTKEVSFNENFLIKSYLVSFVRDFWLAPRCLTTDPESRSSDDTNVIRNHEEVGNQCIFAVFFCRSFWIWILLWIFSVRNSGFQIFKNRNLLLQIAINKRKQLHVFLVVVRFIHNAIQKI